MSTGESNETVLKIKNLTRGTVLAECAIAADNSAKRRTGLLKHKSLPTGKGLWIVPTEGVHTFGMKFAIDILFLSKEKAVRKIKHSVPRNRIVLDFFAHSVLELPAGTAKATGTAAGDQLEFEKIALSV